MLIASLRGLARSVSGRVTVVEKSPSSVHGIRSMATGSKKEWLCIMPDKPNVLEIRKKVKGGHYEGIQPLIKSEKIVSGGAIFEDHPMEGQPPPFKGSVVVYSCESREEVLQMIKNDIYATSGVWDVEKAQVIPYVPAVRLPLSD